MVVSSQPHAVAASPKTKGRVLCFLGSGNDVKNCHPDRKLNSTNYPFFIMTELTLLMADYDYDDDDNNNNNNVQVQKLMGNSITCTLHCNRTTDTTLHPLETWFASGI
jgi:hypothetical protein